MKEQSTFSYIGYIMIYLFILIISLIANKYTSRDLKKNGNEGLYRTKWYNFLSKCGIFVSVFIITLSIIGIIKCLFFRN